MTTSKSPKQSEDLISNALHIVQDKILEDLPIRDAARTSVLSKQWQSNWLSLKRLVFDDDFFNDGGANGQERFNVISSISLHHDGPVHEFIVDIPEQKCLYLSQWLSFLSKNKVRWLEISSECYSLPISSRIFWCSELIRLELLNLTLHSPPSDFTGFPKLQHLYLVCIEFSREDIFPGLIANCCKLVTLVLRDCRGMGHLAIDVPSLEALCIDSGPDCESIAFRDISNLEDVLVRHYGKLPTVETICAFYNLASSCLLECVEFGGDFCKILAGASIKRPVPVTFNHFNKLTLEHLDLSSVGVLQNIVDMVESCPYLKKLVVSIHSSNNADHQKLDSTKVHKSLHLVKVKIMGISGSDVELQLTEYLLSVAVALERLFYQSKNPDAESELELSTLLLGIARASPKARLVRLIRL